MFGKKTLLSRIPSVAIICNHFRFEDLKFVNVRWDKECFVKFLGQTSKWLVTDWITYFYIISAIRDNGIENRHQNVKERR